MGIKKPAVLLGQSELAVLLGLNHRYGVVHYVGRTEFTSNHRLVFQSDDPLEAMQQLEKCMTVLEPDEGCFLLLNQNGTK